MYNKVYSEELAKILSKLKKKDIIQYSAVKKKIAFIIENPNHNYKFLHHDMKGEQRVHIGHFVLVFTVDHKNKIVYFDDFAHHDNIYDQ